MFKTKINLIFALKNGITKISRSSLLNKNLQKLKSIIIHNSYSTSLVQRLLCKTSNANNFLASLDTSMSNISVTRQSSAVGVTDEVVSKTKFSQFCTIPFSKGLSNKLNKLQVKFCNIQVSYYPLIRVGDLFSKLRFKTKIRELTNIVSHMIKCNDY